MSIREFFNAILDFNLLWIVGIIVGLIVIVFVIWLVYEMIDTFYESLPQSSKNYIKNVKFSITGFLDWFFILALLSLILIFFISFL